MAAVWLAPDGAAAQTWGSIQIHGLSELARRRPRAPPSLRCRCDGPGQAPPGRRPFLWTVSSQPGHVLRRRRGRARRHRRRLADPGRALRQAADALLRPRPLVDDRDQCAAGCGAERKARLPVGPVRRAREPVSGSLAEPLCAALEGERVPGQLSRPVAPRWLLPFAGPTPARLGPP